MKNVAVLLTGLLLGFSHVTIAKDFIRIGETNPSVSAYVFGTGEQLSGQQFQTEGIMTYKGYQYTVYYNLTRNVCIARRKLPVGNWEEIKFPYQNKVDDAHNVISMGICHKDGSIHLAYDHHNDDLHYSYSINGSANDPEKMSWEASSFCATTNVMDKAVPNVTYPRFISKPDGNLLFECRFRWSGYGDSYLREYDGDTKKWTLVGRYVQGEDVTPDACAYINGMTYDYLGRLHVTWCWRDDFGGGTNHDFYYGYSEDDGRTWKDTNGEQKAVTENMDPVFSNTTGGCMGQTKKSFMIEEIPYNKGYINQESQATDRKGRIHAVNSQIPGTATDSNWGESRKKARLHHRFRDTDGIWKTILIKNHGENVYSNCRANLSFDAFDNAYVVANGAEVYRATAANGYEDWDLMSDKDKGRFLSEPLVDDSLIQKEGVLSFVYLGADNKITVIDYLLHNPNTPSGTGLTATLFSDSEFETPIKTVKDCLIDASAFSQETKSVRWSGTFETSYAEDYTLYLNTSAASTVYVDGVKVLLTRKTEDIREYSFTFKPIASHKHNIVVESQATAVDAISLSWSSESVEKQLIPAKALYPEFVHDIPVAGEKAEPELPKKVELENQLLGMNEILNKKTIVAPSFNPAGDYTVEVKAQVISSPDCGLVLEGRGANGKGFRISLGETNLLWAAPYATPSLLTVADNSEEQTYRLSVSGEKVYIYQADEYITSVDLTQIGDIDNNGEEILPEAQITDVRLAWAGPGNTGSGKPSDYGWDNAVAGIGWNTANGSSGVRFMDVTSGHTYDGNKYSGRIMTIRWDGSYGAYSFPVELEANTSYEFSMLYEWWNNGTPNSISVGAGLTKNSADVMSVKSFAVGAKNVLQKAVFNFTTKNAGTYYLIFNGQNGAMYGIAGLELKKVTYQPKLTLAKYCEGVSDIRIVNLMYEDGAYAPGVEKPDVELEVKENLPENISGKLKLSGQDGSKDIKRFITVLPEDYTIEVSAQVSALSGRGMDFEVRDAQGIGFRTALNESEFSWIAPFAKQEVVAASDKEEQTIRYAVKGNKVYVYHNGLFVKAFAKQTVGNMDETGTTEKEPYSNTAVNSSDNLIVNPDFQDTPDNGAPAGWSSNGSLGVSNGARVQLKSSTTELSAYPDGTKAFLIRFDGSYTWFSNKITLKADTWYEFSLDLISWGTNTDKTLNLVVSTEEAGAGTVIFTQQLTTPAVRATGERKIVRFKTNAEGDYYITLAKNGSLTGTAGLTNLCLVEYSLNGILVGKNYTNGAAQININYITFDSTGAFAPLNAPEPPVGITPELDETGSDISLEVQGTQLMISSKREAIQSICIYDLSGRKIIHEQSCGHTFSTEISAGVYLVNIVTVNQERIVKKVLLSK